MTVGADVWDKSLVFSCHWDDVWQEYHGSQLTPVQSHPTGLELFARPFYDAGLPRSGQQWGVIITPILPSSQNSAHRLRKIANVYIRLMI